MTATKTFAPVRPEHRSPAEHLTDAAVRFDSAGVREAVRRSIAEHGVLMTWEQLIRPVWDHVRAAAGDTTSPGGAALMFSRAVIEALVPARPRRAGSPQTVLLACANEEHDTLCLEVLAAALAESDTNCWVLGARVPARAVAAAIDRLRPATVVLWSQTPDTADPVELLSLMSARSNATIIPAGPGWNAATIPALAMQPSDVATAAVLILTLPSFP